MKYLVTGASGFIGGAFVQACTARGIDVVGTRGAAGKTSILCNAITMDLFIPEHIRDAVATGGFDCVVHCAAVMPSHTKSYSSEQYIEANVLGTMRLIDCCISAGIRRFIYVSGISVVGVPSSLPVTEDQPMKPRSDYTMSKAMAELICEERNLADKINAVSLRVSAPYGPGYRAETVIPKFIKRALRSEDIILFGTGGRTQDFIYIEDIAAGMLSCMERTRGGVYNLASGTSVTMSELARIIVDLCPESNSNIIYRGEDPEEHLRYVVEIDKIRRDYGFSPGTSLEEGLSRLIHTIRLET